MFSDTVSDVLSRNLGREGYVLVAILLMTLVPAVLFATLSGLWALGVRGRLCGVMAGGLVALWASACWVTVPYCGAYPNLVGALIGAVVFGTDTWGWELSVHATNIAVWPLAGWLVFRPAHTRAAASALR